MQLLDQFIKFAAGKTEFHVKEVFPEGCYLVFHGLVFNDDILLQLSQFLKILLFHAKSGHL